MKKLLLTLALLVIAAAAPFAVAALTYAGDPQGKAPHVGAFTLKRVITRYKPDGTQAVTREIYRRASDGSFRIVETDGQRILLDRGFSQGRGFFRVDYANKTLWRDTTQQPDHGPMPADPAIFTKSEFYVGTDAVLGRTAYHLRVPGRRAGIIDQEHWYFAETGPVPVRASITGPTAASKSRRSLTRWISTSRTLY
ncbi:MAG TPA: hypothetical protein VE713_06010 [Pyrinomonadaceae bacterium]|jgi:hypothetical protein|nr:hypothetical protein [Pyrinomonadaceae bacterium]